MYSLAHITEQGSGARHPVYIVKEKEMVKCKKRERCMIDPMINIPFPYHHRISNKVRLYASESGKAIRQ